METKILFLYHEGMEELEAVAPIDLMRRASLEVTIVAPPHSNSKQVTGRNGMTLLADALWDEIQTESYTVVVIPGGPGVQELLKNEDLIQFLQRSEERRLTAAICAAPLLLDKAGLLCGRDYTAHHSTKMALPKALAEPVISDGPILTSRGAGTAIHFGLELVRRLCGDETRDRIANDIAWPD